MIKREAESTVDNISKTFRVLLVTGPRQVGKTTLLEEHMPENMKYVTLDDEDLRTYAQNDPKMFLQEYKWPLLIDEVQYAPQLFSYIKIETDRKKERGMYWLTGSQQFKLMKNVRESLAGRVGIVKLNSLSYSEIMGNETKCLFDPDNIKKVENVDVFQIFKTIFKGGMPELYDIEDMNPASFFESYIETYLSRDIQDLLDVKDVLQFRKFMVAVATRNGEKLNYSSISREIGITDKTVKMWLDILVTSGVVYLLEPYSSSKLQRLTHMPKIVFMDSGLCAYLAGWHSAEELQLSSNSGHYLESFIVSEIVKSYNARGIEPNISYYRDKDKNEIDLIFFKNNTLYPYEIKKTASPNAGMIKDFKFLENSGKQVGAGGLICFGEHYRLLDDKHYVIPISCVINPSE